MDGSLRLLLLLLLHRLFLLPPPLSISLSLPLFPLLSFSFSARLNQALSPGVLSHLEVVSPLERPSVTSIGPLSPSSYLLAVQPATAFGELFHHQHRVHV